MILYTYMQRVKLTKKNKHGNVGDVVQLSNNEAFGLTDSGQAIITKDITSDDEASKQEKIDGNATKLRSYVSK